jgi:hypothetical protein
MADIDFTHLRATTDLVMFHSGYEGRFVTLKQAGRYIWHHLNSARRRIGQLVEAEYLYSVQDRYIRETIIRPRKRAFEALYARAVISREEYEDPWCWRHIVQAKIGYIHHECQVNEVRFRLIDACRARRGVKLVSCRSGAPIWRRFTVDGTRRWLRPDREVRLALADECCAQSFFVEVDTGSRTICSAKKWTIEKQLLLYGDYAAVSDEPWVVVMLCPTRERIAAIMHEMGRSRPFAYVRAYAVFSDFINDPFGNVLVREDDGSETSIIRLLRTCSATPF